MAPCRSILHCLCALSFVMMVIAEATVAYAARPAVYAVLSMDFYLGGCRVDNLPREGYPAFLGDMMINANSGHKIEAGVGEREHIGRRLVLHFDRRRTRHLLGRVTADGARKARPAERQQFSLAAPHIQPRGIRGRKSISV